MKWIYIILLCLSTSAFSQQLPQGFSYLNLIAPTIQSELRYCSHNNFMGVPAQGYKENVLIASTSAANALKKAQEDLLKEGFSLKIYDAYRPQDAVNHFVRWAKQPHDTLTKTDYYPKLHKRHLFKLGYISTKSGHSRGSSIDLTLVDLKTNKDLDMGSAYDFFGMSSHIGYPHLTEIQRKNRLRLRNIMIKYGFRPYKKEWWHFTLRNEPFPKTYFNFPIE